MRELPGGVVRKRYIEINTKNGSTVSGTVFRVKDDVIYVNVVSDQNEAGVASVDIEDVDVLIVGAAKASDDDSAADED